MQLSMSDLMRVQPPVEPPLGMADATPTPTPSATPFFPSQTVRNVYGVLAIASSGIGFYHGYLRNGGSLGWGLGWAIMGSLAPVLTPALAFAQGIGEPDPRRKREKENAKEILAGLGRDFERKAQEALETRESGTPIDLVAADKWFADWNKKHGAAAEQAYGR